jgi:hypothetical protein
MDLLKLEKVETFKVYFAFSKVQFMFWSSKGMGESAALILISDRIEFDSNSVHFGCHFY